MSLRLWGTISGWGKSAGTMIPALGSGRYAPGPNIVWPSWLNGSDPNYAINACWRQPGLPATVSEIIPFRQKHTHAYVYKWFYNAAETLQNKSVSAYALLEE